MRMEEQRVYISELVPFQLIPECKKSQRVILMPTIALGVDRIKNLGAACQLEFPGGKCGATNAVYAQNTAGE